MSHECPAPGCALVVPRAQLACRHHWYCLPAALRTRVWEAYRSGDVDAHQAAVADAITELRSLS